MRCERNYREGKWMSYDRAFRREALAASNLEWSVPNPRLYQEAFTGRARDIPRCLDDHRDLPQLVNTIPPPPAPHADPHSIRYNKGLCRARCRSRMPAGNARDAFTATAVADPQEIGLRVPATNLPLRGTDYGPHYIAVLLLIPI